VIHGKLLTDENLMCRGCTMVSIYVLCYAAGETSSHLFLECDFATHLWHSLECRLHCVVDLSSVAAILDCIALLCSSQVKDVYMAAIIHTVHVIWKDRNSIRFSSGKVSLHAAMSTIVSLVALRGNASNGHCLHSLSDKLLLDNFLVSPGYRCYKEIIEVI